MRKIIASMLAVLALIFVGTNGAYAATAESTKKPCAMPHAVDPKISTVIEKVGSLNYVRKLRISYTGPTTGTIARVREAYASIRDLEAPGHYRGSVKVYPTAKFGIWTVKPANDNQISGTPRGHLIKITWTLYRNSAIWPNDECTMTNYINGI